jgi:hypothetical protein
MSMLTTAWGVGMVLGSSLGGILSQPADKYPALDIPLLRRYPFLLPCLIVSSVCMLTSGLTYFLLPETLPSKARRKVIPMSSDVEAGPSASPGGYSLAVATTTSESQSDTLMAPKAVAKQPPRRSEDRGFRPGAGGWRTPGSVPPSQPGALEEDPMSDSEAADADQALLPSVGTSTPTGRSGVIGNDPAAAGGGGMLELLRDNNVRMLVLLYGVYAFAAIGMEEIHSVFFAAPVQLGGMGWDSNKIGTSLAVVGLLMTLGQTIVYPAFDRRLGALGTFRAACLMVLSATMAYPMLHTFSARDYARALRKEGGNWGDETSFVPSTSTWLWVVFIALAYKIFGGCGFISISLLINKYEEGWGGGRMSEEEKWPHHSPNWLIFRSLYQLCSSVVSARRGAVNGKTRGVQGQNGKIQDSDVQHWS